MDGSTPTARAFAALEDALDSWRPGWDDDSEVITRARALSLHYTDPQRSRQTPALDPLSRIAYLAYFGPRAIVATERVVGSYFGTTFGTSFGTTGSAPSQVVEIGAGTGASGLALTALGTHKLMLIDRDEVALDTAASLIARMGVTVTTQTRTGFSALRIPDGALVVLSFALAEICDGAKGQHEQDEQEQREKIFSELLQATQKASALIIVDAGDRIGARVVQEFRAAALTAGEHGQPFQLVAPCPHDDLCPALQRKKDWCHTRLARDLPERFAKFAEAIGRDADMIAFSYLVMQPAGDSPPPRADGLRVLGEVRQEKGRVRLPVCGAGGVRFIQVLKRDKAAAKALAGLARGTLAQDPRHVSSAGESKHEDQTCRARGETLHLTRSLDPLAGGRYP